MENASKALLMAGGVLVGMLILSLAVYLFASFGADSRRIHAEMEAREVAQFNSQFTIYVGRNDITIHDIVSVANLAKENNDTYKTYADYKNTHEVIVLLGSKQLHETENGELQNLLKQYSEVDSSTGELIYKFKCITIAHHDNGRVKYIKFDKKN